MNNIVAIEPELDAELKIILDKDLRKAVKTMTASQARCLVDMYYQFQGNRIGADGQVRSQKTEPHEVLSWTGEKFMALENQVKLALKEYARSHYMGRWAMDVTGIGPVIAAGLLAHIDITKAPTVGHIWSFGGVNPEAKWEKGQKRPWNASLKVLFWKIGQSFMKVCNLPDAVYGRIYMERKVLEIANNKAGKYADQCAKALAGKKWQATSDAPFWYGGFLKAEDWDNYYLLEPAKRLGYAKRIAKEKERKPGDGVAMLPPAHIQRRAERYATKLFLAHWHGEAYREHFKTEPPLPYPIAKLDGHTHLIKPDGSKVAVQKVA